MTYGTQRKKGNEMKIKIYDYDNRATEVCIPDDKAISTIFVCILSGDETGIICFADGTTMDFDALCNGLRLHSFFDGCYVVAGEDIQKWINFDADKCSTTISYTRQEAFE